MSMITASMTTALPQPGADPLSMLDEFWCSDCLAPALFERMDAGERSRRAGCEWACTACGAAYLDAIDLIDPNDLIDVVSGDRMAG